jgi:flagellin-like protein
VLVGANTTIQIKELLDDDRAVSPVIGVILMVAITVILAAVIGTFVLGLGDQVSQTTPNASFQFDYDRNATGDDTLEVAHGGGDTIPADEVNATVSGALANSTSTNYNGTLFGESGEITAGSTDSLEGSNFSDTGGSDNLHLNESTVRVNWQSAEGDSSANLGRFSSPDA